MTINSVIKKLNEQGISMERVERIGCSGVGIEKMSHTGRAYPISDKYILTKGDEHIYLLLDRITNEGVGCPDYGYGYAFRKEGEIIYNGWSGMFWYSDTGVEAISLKRVYGYVVEHLKKMNWV